MPISIRIITLVLLLSAAASVSAFAAQLDDYIRRVDSARAGVNLLLENVSRAETGESPSAPDSEIFAELRKRLQNAEKVETSRGTIETNNQWFADGLRTAEDEPDLAKRAVILSELEQRLGSLSVKLTELQDADGVERSKDDDKRKLAEILERPEYQRPEVEIEEQSQGAKLLTQFLDWLKSFFPDVTPPQGAGAGPMAFAGLLQWILIIAVILVLGFVLYKLFPLFAPRFRNALREEREERVILGERIAEDRSAQDLFGEAERLAREGDIRGAIRKGYIALLCELSDRKLIGLARHKTNRDYLRDVRSRKEIYDRMNGLTGAFERHWYGSQNAGSGDWETFRENCGDTLKAV